MFYNFYVIDAGTNVIAGNPRLDIIYSSVYFVFLGKMGKTKKAEEQDQQPPKKSMKELEKEDKEKALETKARAETQRLMSATCLKSDALPSQKAMYAQYKAAPRFSELKEQLLNKFMADKKCGWFQQLDSSKSEAFQAVNVGLKGYGTQWIYKFINVCFGS
jgi:hypothetical protein